MPFLSILTEIPPILQAYWTPGERHRLALGLSGWLRKRGFTQEEVAAVIAEVAASAGDEELGDRLQAVADSFATPLEEVAGWQILAEILPEEALRELEGATPIAHVYQDADGKPLFRVLRWGTGPGKRFLAQRWTPTGWQYDLDGVRPVLYRLPEVQKAVRAGETVFVVEGEKCADALARLGLVATTAPFGASSWRPEYAEHLRGAKGVVILPDNDQAGHRHAKKVLESLQAAGIPARIVELPGLGPGEDVADWLAAGHTKGDLMALLQGTETAASGLLAKIVEHAQWVLTAPPVEWLWDGLLYRGGVFLLAGPPKRGKSTFLTLLLERLSGPEQAELRVRDQVFTLLDGTFLGRRFRGGQRILLITENPPQFWRKRPLLRGVAVLSAFDVRRAGVEALAELVRSAKFDVVAIDALDKAIPVRDENDNSEWAEKLAPLIEATREGRCALLLVHHHRKRGGSGGEEIRGGTGLFGGVDEYLAFTATPTEDRAALLCTLEPAGRVCDPTPLTFHMTLHDAWVPECRERNTDQVILAALAGAEEPVTREELATITGLPDGTLKRKLSELVDKGKVEKIGGGRKGKPARYAVVGRTTAKEQFGSDSVHLGKS